MIATAGKADRVGDAKSAIPPRPQNCLLRHPTARFPRTMGLRASFAMRISTHDQCRDTAEHRWILLGRSDNRTAKAWGGLRLENPADEKPE